MEIYDPLVRGRIFREEAGKVEKVDSNRPSTPRAIPKRIGQTSTPHIPENL
jgi:hypothetical protein